MEKYIDNCVGCPPGMGCLGSACPNQGWVEVCDCCDSETAEYSLDGEHLCEHCLREKIDDDFSQMSLCERAELLGYECHALY